MLEGMGRLRTQLRRTADARPSGVAPVAAIRLSAACSVSAGWGLPRLDARVPLELTPRRLASANAAVARFLLNAKAVRERDVPPAWNDELLVCQGALDAWVKREFGALHCLAPQFVLRPVWGSARDPCGSSTQKVEYSQIQISWFQQDEQQWAVGRGLDRLEHATPTLGATALHLLDERSRYVYPVFTPRTAQDVASMMYWYGEEDETFALEEACADDEEARAALREEMVTKASMAEAFPAWALAWRSEMLAGPALARIAAHGSDEFTRDVAALLTKLARLKIKDDCRPEIDGEFIGFGAVLSWHPDDLTVRVYDDLINNAHQGEFCDVMGDVFFDLDEPRAFAAWQRKMRSRFEAIRLIDALIWRLSEAN
jgi:PRTRC genetic system protein F